MQRLGQHFLKNKSALEKIISALELAAGDVVFEIGPGHGELTTPLAAACEKLQCNIVAIEKDADLINGPLAEKVAALKNVKIVHGDVLKILPPEIEARIGNRIGARNADHEPAHYKIVGNIPYYITGKLLRVIGDLGQKPERAVLMVQKEVAERICDVPPSMNRLAASIQFWAEPKMTAVVSKNDFSPPPKVDSAIILLKTKHDMPNIEAEKYYAALRAIFAQPRKTILNNISAAASVRDQNEWTKQEISTALEAISVNPLDRPQNLSVENIILIAKTLF